MPEGQLKTHCVAGHEYTPENTGFYSDGGRHCRTCRRIGDELYRGGKEYGLMDRFQLFRGDRYK